MISQKMRRSDSHMTIYAAKLKFVSHSVDAKETRKLSPMEKKTSANESEIKRATHKECIIPGRAETSLKMDSGQDK